MAAPSPVTDKRPPSAVLRVVNPLMRIALTSPAARMAPAPLAVLRFEGRRTGRTYRIVVGLSEVDGAPAVFTAARWRLNFRGGAPVTVERHGATRTGTGTLVEDPEVVAAALQSVLDSGIDARMLGLDVPAGHRVGADDIRAIGRSMIRLDVG